MVDGEIQAQASEDFATLMRQAGLSKAWYHQFVHTWEGAFNLHADTFANDHNNSLSIQVDCDRGNLYLSGTGEVIKLEGGVLTLP